MTLDITTILVILTALLSFTTFSNGKMMDDLIFYPPAIQRGQWYRFISHGFIHADVFHLAFNMLALYSFGRNLEDVFARECVFAGLGKLFYLLLYFVGMIIASLPDYLRYRDSYHFRSLGASGAVSAIVFAYVVFFPKAQMGLLFLPGIQVPAIVFAVIYLGFTFYLDRRGGGGNINHSAHLWGSLFGVVFTLVICQLFAHGFDVYENFRLQMQSSSADLVFYCDYTK